jgi:hypothetical protein
MYIIAWHEAVSQADLDKFVCMPIQSMGKAMPSLLHAGHRLSGASRGRILNHKCSALRERPEAYCKARSLPGGLCSPLHAHLWPGSLVIWPHFTMEQCDQKRGPFPGILAGIVLLTTISRCILCCLRTRSGFFGGGVKPPVRCCC